MSTVFFRIFGVKFLNANINSILKIIDKSNLIVVPSGPGLASVDKDKEYLQAIQSADFAILDSGYFCILLFFFKGLVVKKISGLLLIKNFIKYISKKKNTTLFTIDPNKIESLENKKLLESKSISMGKHQYVAPFYNPKKIIDKKLKKILQRVKPRYILINLGSGVQEVLGSYLAKNLSYNPKPTILCTGAAIAFLTRRQAPVSDLFDRMYLGWLVRCFYNPRKFIQRYAKAFRLLLLVKKHKLLKLK